MFRPVLCNYYVTFRCNVRCTFCDIWKNTKYRNTADCTTTDVVSNLSSLKRAGVKFIDFTGGEPLLNDELPDMLSAAKQSGFRTSVTTNCLLYPKKADELHGKVDFLHFSLDSMNPEQHDRLRGRPIFERVMKSIELALSIGERPDLLFTVTPENYEQIEPLSRFTANRKLILLVNPVFNYTGQQPITTAILNHLERYRGKPYVYMNLALHRLIRRGGNDRNRARCRAVSSSVVISPDNEIMLPCYHFAQQRIKIEGNLTTIFESELFRHYLKKQGRFSFCENCTINCYFDPSFLYKPDAYFALSLLSKAKYALDKYVKRR